MWDHLSCDDTFSVLLELELPPPHPVNIINEIETAKVEIFFMNKP